MFLKIVFLLLMSIILCVVRLDPTTRDASNYGPFTLTYEHYGDCKGSKSKNLTIMTTKLSDDEICVGIVNFTFLIDAKIDEMKLQVHNLKDNKKTFLWNYKLNEPCKHFAFAAIIKQTLKANSNCVVKKGNYYNTINFRDVVSAFLGNSFFYGTYMYKAEMYSKKGNIACFNTTMKFVKKM